MDYQKGNKVSSTVKYVIGLGIRAPIKSGLYRVDTKEIIVSYPKCINFGIELELPKSLSTQFEVTWDDPDSYVRLKTNTHERFLPIYEAMAAINKLLLAFKLSRIGNSEGSGVRSVGSSDQLYSYALVDNSPQDLTLGLMIQQQDYPHLMPNAQHPEDNSGTTDIAKRYIDNDEPVIAKRIVRSFELIELGLFSESFLVSFSVLDDVTQMMLQELHHSVYNSTVQEQERYTSDIRNNRLERYLNSCLEELHGKKMQDLWEHFNTALTWFNRLRNQIAHNGALITHSEAKVGLYVALKIIITLDQEQLLRSGVNAEMYREAKMQASWSETPPSWVPSGQAASSTDFNG